MKGLCLVPQLYKIANHSVSENHAFLPRRYTSLRIYTLRSFALIIVHERFHERLSVNIKQNLNFAAVVEKSISFVFCI